MKLSPLLAQYLMSNQQLSLVGIGRFVTESQSRADGSPELTIRFNGNKAEKMDEGLVNFVARETGKMKSLAEADLVSYIDQMREFLNIGKPFFLEGIGTLTPLKEGVMEFTAGQIQAEKSKEFPLSEKDSQVQGAIGEDHSLDYSDILGTRKAASNARNKWLTGAVVIVGLGLAIWGGYTLFKSMMRSKADSSPEITTQPVTDTLAVVTTPVNQAPVADPVSSQTYKFIVKEASMRQAYTRYQYLKDQCKVDVHISTTDSVRYQVFFRLPALPSDTTRIADSLNVLYISKGQPRVKVVKY
ncbi:MAG: hypothetical protein SFU20_15205 [Chitinophagaceae bacterium]|nr:hypothetical protein [Chitinophagaceae bacterium]